MLNWIYVANTIIYVKKSLDIWVCPCDSDESSFGFAPFFGHEKSNFQNYSNKICRSLEDIKNYLNINFHEKISTIGFFLAKNRRETEWRFVTIARTHSYVPYLNNEISLCDFEYIVVTHIWWPLTARDCFCYKKWSAKPFNVIKQFFFWLSISPHTCFFFNCKKNM